MTVAVNRAIWGLSQPDGTTHTVKSGRYRYLVDKTSRYVYSNALTTQRHYVRVGRLSWAVSINSGRKY